MSKKLPKAVRDQIVALRHLPQRDVAKRLRVSIGAVSGVLANVPPAETAAGAIVADDAAPRMPDLTGVTDEATLTSALESLHGQREVARTSRDLARSIQIEKAIADVTARRAKLRPPTPPNPDDDPMWRELSQRFRASAHERLDRILGGAGVK